MNKLFGDDRRASALRTLLRSVVIVATAFGAELSAEQVAAIQVGLEAVIQFGRSFYPQEG